MNHLIELKKEFPELTLETYVQFLNTHWYDLTTNEDIDIIDVFFEWAWVNHVIEEIRN
jgi:hypothetical protein